MKKIFYILLFFILSVSVILHSPVSAATNIENDIGPIPCFGGACPPDLPTIYTQTNTAIPAYAYAGESCVSTYEQFLVNPAKLHFWAEDIDVTNQGKADERARQFIYWVITKPAIDNHAVIKGVWNTTRNISYFLVIIVAAVIGIGFIISQRTNFNLKIKIWPAIWKILFALLYITFSAALILFLIQLSELLMKFFIDRLGGKDLFNIYFSSSQSSESNYTYFYGCRDLNIRAQEAADTEMLMLKFTNITYYVMGSLLLLRKILLWFLLFVSPFLAILMPFVFIRNTGWIWIGVFFQWLFYGPLFALFLGALSAIWKAGIPFQFDFSRRGTAEGYIYPTAIRILYGGPAQRLSILNNANYVDTYVEYIITLLMLWAVAFFPWWLLRIFRDYCCDVFAAANNVLLSMYDQMRAGPIAPPPASQIPKSPPRSTAGSARDIPRGEGRTQVERPVTVRVQTMSEIKQSNTQDILTSLNLYAPRLTDIARFETNKESKSAVEKNLSFIANPVKAETPTERQQYMNIRTELFSRASKEDSLARGVISSTSTSFVEKEKQKEEILKNTPQAVAVSQAVSSTTQISKEKVQSITNNILNSVVNNNTATSTIAQNANVSQEQVKSILNTYSQNLSQPTNQVISSIAQTTNTTKEKVSDVIKQAMNISEQSNVVSQTALREKVSSETVQKILQSLPMAVSQMQTQSVSQNIAVTANIPLEKAQSITNNIFNNVANNSKITNALAQSTNLSQNQVQSVLNSYTKNTSQPASQIINTISKQTNVSKEKVAEVLNKSNVVMQQSTIVKETASAEKTDAKTVEKIVQSVSETIKGEAPKVVTGVSAEKTQSITNNIVNAIVNNSQTMQTLQQETNLPANQLRNVLTTYSQNISQTPEVITERISQSAGIEKQKVAPVLKQVLSSIRKESVVPQATINEIAKKENVKVSDIKKVVDAQVPMVTEPDKHVEKSIAIPSTISLEDYEEVKKMWTQQYEKGEVPTMENIATREQWVDQDSVMITNTLNKLMANDESVRREGLDDLGYILPIFMINNMKGDEMLVYLKAKLEAAKSVKEQMIKEKEAIVQTEEELVDIERTTAETAQNVLHMEVEENVSQPEVMVTETGGYTESKSYAQPIIKVTRTQPAFVLKVDEIKNIKTNDLVRNMNMFAEKITDIARFDTNRETRETVTKHIEYLANPEKASSSSERQTYIDIRTELTTRGVQDHAAQQLISPSKEHMLQSVPQAVPAVNVVSNMVNLPQEKVSSIITTIINTAVTNQPLLQSIQSQTGINENEVKNILNTYIQNVNQPSNVIVDRIAKSTGIDRAKIAPALQTAMRSINTDTASSKDIIKKTATKEGVTEVQASKVLGTHVPMVTKAEENVEKSVPIPAGVSIEDYEEVKKMWTEQYEKGEVPTGENITSREQWIDQDTVMLTNVLNGLLSPDEKLRRQALDDVGVLLPIFMVNNLTGEELLVYLKAKLEAAKAIKTELAKTQVSVEQPEEELIEIKRETSTPQTLHMEVEAPAEKKEGRVQMNTTESHISDEGEESALTDTLASMKHSTKITAPFTMSSDEIKNVKTNDLMRSLNIAVQKLTDIARIDTNRATRETVKKHIEFIADPAKAATPAEQQTYKEIRKELTNRSDKDATAKQLISPVQDHILKDFPKAVPMTNAVSGFVKLSSEKIQSITAAVLNAVAQNKNILNVMNQNIQIPQDTIQNTLITFTHSMYIPSNLVIDTIGTQLDLPNETVARILQEINNDIQLASILDLKDILKKTAVLEKITEDIVKQVIAAQIQIIIAPEAHIENTIPMSSNVSIEDYEEVKDMWADQYENGEIPVGENIDSRESWINQDIILITNILNKLLSSDDKLRLEAMNEIGFLLPIFMLNNLSGQELLMYLKAKLEAAKLVLKQLKKETDLKDKLKQISASEAEEVVVTKQKKNDADANKKEMKVEVEPEKNSKQ